MKDFSNYPCFDSKLVWILGWGPLRRSNEVVILIRKRSWSLEWFLFFFLPTSCTPLLLGSCLLAVPLQFCHNPYFYPKELTTPLRFSYLMATPPKLSYLLATSLLLLCLQVARLWARGRGAAEGRRGCSCRRGGGAAGRRSCSCRSSRVGEGTRNKISRDKARTCSRTFNRYLPFLEEPLGPLVYRLAHFAHY